jgi:hypothetical protein
MSPTANYRSGSVICTTSIRNRTAGLRPVAPSWLQVVPAAPRRSSATVSESRMFSLDSVRPDRWLPLRMRLPHPAGESSITRGTTKQRESRPPP